MGDVPNQPDLSRLGPQTSVPSTTHARLSETPGGPQGNPSSVTRPAPSPGFMPGLGRDPNPPIPQPFRFVGSGLGLGPLRAGRPIPSRLSHTAVSTSEPQAPLTRQGEGTGLPAMSSRGDRYELPPPLRVLPPHFDSQSTAPPLPPLVTTDMGAHAGAGYPGVASQTGVPENPTPRRGFSLGYQPPENPRPSGILSLGRLPSRGGQASLSGLSRPQVTSTITRPSVTSAAPGFPADPLPDTPGYTQLLEYLQTDPAWGGAPRRTQFSTEPEVGPLVGSLPSVPVVPPVTSHVGSQPRSTTMEPPNASTVPTGLPTGSATAHLPRCPVR